MAEDDPLRSAHDIRASLINLRGFCGELESALDAARRQLLPADAVQSLTQLDDAHFCAGSIRTLIDRLETQLEPGVAPRGD